MLNHSNIIIQESKHDTTDIYSNIPSNPNPAFRKLFYKLNLSTECKILQHMIMKLPYASEMILTSKLKHIALKIFATDCQIILLITIYFF